MLQGAEALGMDAYHGNHVKSASICFNARSLQKTFDFGGDMEKGSGAQNASTALPKDAHEVTPHRAPHVRYI